MMKINPPKLDLRPYHTFGLPLLGLMGMIALAGIALTVVLRFI
ncbi:MAG TPA: hypothetical protein VLI69_08195 [Gammaproteobacteria bacterium]|nr:hypothetical protein [Gammaproteobacteria bacterium]